MSVAKQGEASVGGSGVSGSESEKGKFIKLKVIGDDDMAMMEFRVRMNAKLDKIREEYSKTVHIPMAKLRFFYDGKRINGLTPKMMEMQDNDVIDVYAEQEGAGSAAEPSKFGGCR